MAASGTRKKNSVYDDAGNKRCYVCKIHYETTAFGSNAASWDGLSSLCKPCARVKSARSNALKTPEQERMWRRARMADPEKRARTLANKKAWQAANPEKAREIAMAGQLKTKYGLTRADYKALVDGQAGVCAVCSGPPPTGKRLVVDHNHETGKIRALLCSSCNIMIGHSQERPEALEAGAAYLRRHAQLHHG
jgi:hypothetical protein